MRTAQLTTVQAGISRLRLKGGSRADSLYDLVNARVTQDGSVVPRTGLPRLARLPSTTHGLCAFNGVVYVFSITIQTLAAPFSCLVVAHPTDPSQDIKKVHFAQPFLGFIYAAIEWNNGDIFHYWFRSSGKWSPNTVYKVGDVVEPTVANGLAYEASRLTSANPPWTPSTPHVLTDVVEPTTYNGFKYTVIDVSGASPHSGTTEPSWPETVGATINEDADADLAGAPVITPNPTNTVPKKVSDRYGSGTGASP